MGQRSCILGDASGCTNRAAPVFGMVCSKHKDLPKGEIKKYREARKAQKAKAKKKG